MAFIMKWKTPSYGPPMSNVSGKENLKMKIAGLVTGLPLLILQNMILGGITVNIIKTRVYGTAQMNWGRRYHHPIIKMGLNIVHQ